MVHFDVYFGFPQAVKEKETLRRSYFLFIASVVTNEVIEVLTNQGKAKKQNNNNNNNNNAHISVQRSGLLCNYNYNFLIFNFFNFFPLICTVLSDPQHIHQVMITVIQGGVEYPDPMVTSLIPFLVFDRNYV